MESMAAAAERLTAVHIENARSLSFRCAPVALCVCAWVVMKSASKSAYRLPRNCKDGAKEDVY